MNPFGGTAFNPANDVTGSWSWEDDWFQDTNGNVYYIANGNGYKQFFRGTRSGNRITGELIRYNPSGCRMILNQTFTQTDANTMQYSWIGVGNCDVINGQRGEGTITRSGQTSSSGTTLTVSQQPFQTEVEITIRISGAAPNSDVTVKVSNVPLTADQSCRIRTNNEGVGSCTLRYPYTQSWCSLTPAYQLARGIVMANSSNRQTIATTDFGIYNLYSRPVGGNCPNNLAVNIKTGGDDLRGGRSRAFIQFHFRNNVNTAEFPLSNGEAWTGNSWQSRDFAIGTHNPDDLVGVTIRHDGTPNNDPFNGGNLGDTYDNWNIDKVVVRYNGGLELINLGGTPLVRFKGDLREQRWNR
jgi:hypothetical protein